MSRFEALNKAIKNRSYDDVRNISSKESENNPDVNLKTIIYENFEADDMANVLIPFDIAWPNEDVVAIKTVENGNCLFNSLSYLSCQLTYLATPLRLLTAAELFLNAEKYTTHPKFVNCTDLTQMIFSEPNLWTVLLRDDASSRLNISREEAVVMEAANTAMNYTWSGMLDIFVASSVLKTQIWCCYPECNETIRTLLSARVYPH